MDKQRVCKICSKRFSNGKAMGGHMRSHLAKLPIPVKQQHHQQQQQRLISTANSSSSSFNLKPKKLLIIKSLRRSPDYSEHSDLSIQDPDSETDSDSLPQFQNPKRRRNRIYDNDDDNNEAAEPISSETTTTTTSFSTTEDVALCLLKMSRDRWNREDEDENEDEDVEEEEEEEDVNVHHHSRNRKFRCKTCNKSFRSYQALGGHKASHKKSEIHNNNSGGAAGITAITRSGEDEFENNLKFSKVFECPFCPKVFESGQALGGHKKIHLSQLGNNNIKNSHQHHHRLRNSISIDLNRPALEEDENEEDDDDEEVVSAIPDPNPITKIHHDHVQARYRY